MKRIEIVAIVGILVVTATLLMPKACTVNNVYPKIEIFEPLPSPTPNIMTKELERATKQLQNGE